MGNSLIQTVDDTYRQDRCEILRLPVRLGSGGTIRDHLPGPDASAQFDTRLNGRVLETQPIIGPEDDEAGEPAARKKMGRGHLR